MKRLAALAIAAFMVVSMPLSAFATEADSEEINSGEVVEEALVFPFTVYLKDKDGNPLEGTFEYTGTSNNGTTVADGTIANGDTIILGDKDYIDILNLPAGTQYEVVEGETEGFTLFQSNNTSGVIVTDTLSHAEFVNKENGSTEPVETLKISIHGSKIIDQTKGAAGTKLQITKLVSDYTSNYEK